MSILENIRGHESLSVLTQAQRTVLCQEVRDFLIRNVARTGGHLASNLGVVELTVALETVFDTEHDRLVFDVGHQSYVHKLLTGRQADFAQLRKFGGMAGFPKPSESVTDAFVAGHASSSVSIALGMARARTLQKQDHSVIALIGDGAATGGMAYEGLNDAADSREPLIVILNDNEMSIDRNVGGLARHLSKLRTREHYLNSKARYKRWLSHIPGGKGVYRFTRSVKNRIKRFFLPTTIFENMGFTYLGPVDGHNTEKLISLLRRARQLQAPVLIHVMTQKGRGYKFAEENPTQFHGVGKFDTESGQPLKGGSCVFSDAFGEELTKLADKDSRICAITAAMPGGTGLLGFKQAHPDRLFDVGIAEEHAVSMAGGLAKQGMVPVVALYSTFLQRSFDQILQDISMLNLHVILAVDRAGLVGEDGETHHGVFDVGYLRQAPGMTILAPASCRELQGMLRQAIYSDGPVAVRYPRGGDGGFEGSMAGSHVALHKEGRDVMIVTYGITVNAALYAAELLAHRGIDAGVIRLLTLSPLPTVQLHKLLKAQQPVVIIEEAMAGSGIHEALSCKLRELEPARRVYARDLGSTYIPHGSQRALFSAYGLDAEGIAKFTKEVLGT